MEVYENAKKIAGDDETCYRILGSWHDSGLIDLTQPQDVEKIRLMLDAALTAAVSQQAAGRKVKPEVKCSCGNVATIIVHQGRAVPMCEQCKEKMNNTDRIEVGSDVCMARAKRDLRSAKESVAEAERLVRNAYCLLQAGLVRDAADLLLEALGEI